MQKLQVILRRLLVQSRPAPEWTAKWENGRFQAAVIVNSKRRFPQNAAYSSYQQPRRLARTSH